MLNLASDILNDVENAVKQPRFYRRHLGASLIGKSCARSVWYSFRWATRKKLPANIIRLLARGDRAESVFESALKAAGFELYTHNKYTGEQFGFEEFGGHLGGSIDGVINLNPHFDAWALLEFKTHNQKSFNELKKGVKSSKPAHYAQMQMYMGKMNLGYALYCAINKNDDKFYFEIVDFSKEYFNRYMMRAELVLDSNKPLDRISNKKSWHECKICDHFKVCHEQGEMVKSCRTCKFSKSDKLSGEWVCGKHNKNLTKNDQIAYCSDFSEIK